MSSGFNQREEGNEAKIKHDSDVHFRIQARRDKLLGEWVAAQLGLEGDAAAKYALEVVKADIQEPGDDDVLKKILADFKKHGIDHSEDAVSQRMAEFESIATEQVHEEGFDADD